MGGGQSLRRGGYHLLRHQQRGRPTALQGAFGLDDEGYPVWSQPTGAHDAYKTGDIVNYNGTLYKSLIDGNTWAPDAYPQGWEVYTE